MNEVKDLSEMTLEELKAKADVLGVKYSGNISSDTLRTRIEDREKELDQAEEAFEEAKLKTEGTDSTEEVVLTEEDRLKAIAKEQNRLVRVIIAPMTKDKGELTAELFTVSNDLIHDSRVMPFHVEWHCTEALARYIESLESTIYRSVEKNTEGAQQKPVSIRAYTVTRLPPISQDEYDEIRQRQLAQPNE